MVFAGTVTSVIAGSVGIGSVSIVAAAGMKNWIVQPPSSPAPCATGAVMAIRAPATLCATGAVIAMDDLVVLAPKI